jgi:hypothetical protein
MPSHVPGSAPSEVQQILNSEGVSSKGGEGRNNNSSSPGYIIYFLSVFPKLILLKVKRARKSVADGAGTGKGNGSGEGEGDKTMEGDGAGISEENSGEKQRPKRRRKQAKDSSSPGFIICFLSVFPKYILSRRSQGKKESKEVSG